MADIRSIEPGKYNLSLAQALKEIEEFQKPEWVDFVKSGTQKQRPIQDTDFWYKRAASILRQLYVQGSVGVQRLRTRYGGRKDRGMKPARFKKGSGKIIRVLLQQCEKAELVEKSQSKKAGRQLTKKGKDFFGEFGKMTGRSAEYFESGEFDDHFRPAEEVLSKDEPILHVAPNGPNLIYALRRGQGDILTDHYLNTRQLYGVQQ